MANEQDLTPLLDAQQNRLGQIMSDSDGIDTKALAILGTNLALIIFIAQAGLHIPTWEFAVLYIPFGLSFLLDLFSVWPRKYYGLPDLDDVPEYLAMDHDTLVLQLLADTSAAIHHNEQLNRVRMRFCLVSIVLTGLGFAVLLAIL